MSGSPIRAARAEQLARYLVDRGGSVSLTPGVFEVLRERGLDRADVEIAVDDLVGAGDVRLVASTFGVRVALVREGLRAA